MSKKKEQPNIIKALDFVSVAQRDTGAPYQTHVRMAFNMLTACDGVLSAGHRIDEDIRACPHSSTLLSALKKCDGVISVAQLDSGRLSVKSGGFRAYIQCSDQAVLPDIMPDPRAGVASNSLRVALETVSPLIVENSQRVVTASAMIRSGSVQATTGHMIMEYWHGLVLPTVIVPKLFINALSKIKKDIVAYGNSDSSFTVFFEDDSWLKTQVYKEKWPDCDRILDRPHTPGPIPADLFKGLAAVEPFITDNRVRLGEGYIASHSQDGVGARYDIEGMGAGVVIPPKSLSMLEGLVTLFDFKGAGNVSYFYGDNLRGCVAQCKD